MKGALPIHVDPDGWQVQPYFTCLHTLGVAKVGRHGEGCACKSFGVGDVRIQISRDIVGKIIGVNHIVEVARGARIYRCRKPSRSSRDGTMVPLYPESIVVERNEFRFWTDKFLKIHVKPSTVAIFLGIHGLGFDAPATFGIHITCDP